MQRAHIRHQRGVTILYTAWLQIRLNSHTRIIQYHHRTTIAIISYQRSTISITRPFHIHLFTSTIKAVYFHPYIPVRTKRVYIPYVHPRYIIYYSIHHPNLIPYPILMNLIDLKLPWIIYSSMINTAIRDIQKDHIVYDHLAYRHTVNQLYILSIWLLEYRYLYSNRRYTKRPYSI